jgi:hypothetical protein
MEADFFSRTCERCVETKEYSFGHDLYQHYVFVLALIIRHTKPSFSTQHYIVMFGFSGSTIVSTSHKQQDFQIKVIKHKMCFLTFCTTLFETSLDKKSARYFHECSQVFMEITRY